MTRLAPSHLPVGSVSGREQPIIDGETVALRPFEPDDAEWLSGVYQDPDIQRWHLLAVHSVDEAAGWIAASNSAWRAETDATWLVADLLTRQRLGRISLRDIDLGGGSAEVSYWVAPEARGRRVARAALLSVTRWAVEDIGFHRLTVTHSTENLASCAVATSAGYAAEGTARSTQRHLDGWHDKHVHAFIAGDPWPS